MSDHDEREVVAEVAARRRAILTAQAERIVAFIDAAMVADISREANPDWVAFNGAVTIDMKDVRVGYGKAWQESRQRRMIEQVVTIMEDEAP